MSDSVIFLESSPCFGGQERQLLQQISVLSERGYNCLLVCRKNSRIDEEARKSRCVIVNLPLRNSLDFYSILGIRRLLKKHNPVACISHSGHDSNCLSVAARTTIPRTNIIRSKTWGSEKKPSSWRLFFVDVVMVPSVYLAGKITSDWQSRNVAVVYPGIDFTRLDKELTLPLESEIEAWLQTRSPLIVHAAMFRKEKNHHLMLSVLRQLVKTYPDIGYLALGEGSEKDNLNVQANEYGVQNNVFLTLASHVSPVMSKADIVVMPSSDEALGMSQIEALGLGIPVIVSTCGGLPETVCHEVTGLVVKDFLEDSWVNTITYALENPIKMRELAQSGRNEVRKRFSRDENTWRLISIIHSKEMASDL